MPFAKVINRVKISNHDVRAGRRVIGGHRDVTARFMAQLSQPSDLLALDDGQVTAGYLDERARDGAHDEGEEEWVAFLASAAEVGHE